MKNGAPRSTGKAGKSTAHEYSGLLYLEFIKKYVCTGLSRSQLG